MIGDYADDSDSADDADAVDIKHALGRVLVFSILTFAVVEANHLVF